MRSSTASRSLPFDRAAAPRTPAQPDANARPHPPRARRPRRAGPVRLRRRRVPASRQEGDERGSESHEEVSDKRHWIGPVAAVCPGPRRGFRFTRTRNTRSPGRRRASGRARRTRCHHDDRDHLSSPHRSARPHLARGRSSRSRCSTGSPAGSAAGWPTLPGEGHPVWTYVCGVLLAFAAIAGLSILLRVCS